MSRPGASAAVAMGIILLAASACAHRAASGDAHPAVMHVALPSGASAVDVYRPVDDAAAPMVIVAHGFSRHRGNMSGWGRHLAAQGIVAVVPDLPSWSDHARNGRFLSELHAFMLTESSWAGGIDARRTGLLGFSAGGLSSLLCAADTPGVAIWIGLDPVDRDGLGAQAAGRVRAEALVLTAEPSSCNAQGNAQGIIAALPRCRHERIAGAVHVDAEWPTSWLAELVCGRSTAAKQHAFRMHVTEALRQAFAARP